MADSLQRVRVNSMDGVLAAVPLLLGFHPSNSLVVLGLSDAGPRQKVQIVFRYDLDDSGQFGGPVAETVAHAVSVLVKRKLTAAFVIGYGTGPAVTPFADSFRAAFKAVKIELRDMVRVEGGRYFSYLCTNPACCPAEGVPYDVRSSQVTAEGAYAGISPAASREDLARQVAPVTGRAAARMQQALIKASNKADRMIGTGPDRAPMVIVAGQLAVAKAVAAYREGKTISNVDEVAWLAVTLPCLPVRDYAWALMDPEYRQAHLELWANVARNAGKLAAAPLSLFAFVAWQTGQGTLANVALERALSVEPGYSMALLLGEALDAGVPSSVARPPMTPEEVIASYNQQSA